MHDNTTCSKKEQTKGQVPIQLDILKQQVECLRERIGFLKDKIASVVKDISEYPAIEEERKPENPGSLVPLADELNLLSNEILGINVLIDKLNHEIEL